MAKRSRFRLGGPKAALDDRGSAHPGMLTSSQTLAPTEGHFRVFTPSWVYPKWGARPICFSGSRHSTFVATDQKRQTIALYSHGAWAEMSVEIHFTSEQEAQLALVAPGKAHHNAEFFNLTGGRLPAHTRPNCILRSR